MCVFFFRTIVNSEKASTASQPQNVSKPSPKKENKDDDLDWDSEMGLESDSKPLQLKLPGGDENVINKKASKKPTIADQLGLDLDLSEITFEEESIGQPKKSQISTQENPALTLSQFAERDDDFNGIFREVNICSLV